MKVNKKYTGELSRKFGYLATWLPETPLALGDIGILKKNQFTRISNLADLGIDFEVIKDNSKSDIEHSSEGAVSISTKASGSMAPANSVLGELDAGMLVEFSKTDAVLFKANGTLSPSIKDQIGLGKKVLKLYQEGKWDKDWAVITELVTAESATILISGSNKGKVELKAKGNAEAATIDIANAELNFEISFSKDLSTKIIAQENLTPLFRASKVKSRFLMPPVFGIRALSAMDLMTPDKAKEDESLLYFDKVDYDNQWEDE
ncbi:hypothetical protein [Aureispira anguillae]|uniref:Uncharacterized protein n=1 Tax=Aureispira anguillae TaxID=2864201 RepID=A0A916DST6_9BACT|nr:hypothetical protein [Aureispira anguillae]BDS11277.1 hypothetical protein AsAng_0019890 [Aureispira anguillae]